MDPHHLQTGVTALLLASDEGHLEVVRLLLKAGAAVFIPEKVWRVFKLLFFGDCSVAYTDW